MKILDIGSGPESVAAKVFADAPDLHIVRLDGDKDVKPDVVHDITKPLPARLQGQFDIVYCSHVLEHIDRANVIPTLQNISQGLVNLGELWVIVPSMEWAAAEILQRREGAHIQGLLYGSQTNPFQYHKVGFTLSSLRTLCEAMGLVIRKAYQSPFGIITDLGEQTCIQNVVVAARYDGLQQLPEKRANPGAQRTEVRRRKRKKKK